MATTFEELIRRCNEFLFVHLYPGGQLDVPSNQHRDLVRTFMGGAMEMLIAMNEGDLVRDLINDYQAMADEHWWPDDRFSPPPGYRRHLSN